MRPEAGRFDELVPTWLFAVRSPVLRALLAVGLPLVTWAGLVTVSDGSASRLGPPLVLLIIAVAGLAGWRTVAVCGAAITSLYWVYGVPVQRSFHVSDSASAIAVAGMAVVAVGVAVLTRQIERVVNDVRGLDQERQLEAEQEARIRLAAERTRDMMLKIVRLSTALGGARATRQVADTVLDELDVPVWPTTCSIAIVVGDHLRVIADRGASPAGIRAVEAAPLSSAPWLLDVLAGEAAYVDDRDAFAAQHPDEGVLRLYPSGAWAVIPFRSNDTIGLLSLHYLSPQPLARFSRFFSLVAELLANALERAAAEERLAEQVTELEAAFAERDRIARTLSTTLLPPTLPTLAGFEAAAWLLPAHGDEVAGDFYDLLPVGDGDWVAVLGDVCGKGAEAAAVTSLARYAARATALHDPDPGRISDVANTALLRDPSDLFCTMVIVRYSSRAEELQVTLAGHPQARVVTNGVVHRVGTFARPLGLATKDAPVVRVPFRPGDAVAVFTDGVVDRNPTFDEAAVEELLLTCSDLPAAAIATRVRERLESLAVVRPDDAAFLVLRRIGPATEA